MRPFARDFPALAVSCTSTSFCAELDEETDGAGGIVVSADPAGDESSWHRVFAGPLLDRISCASEALCVAVAQTEILVSSSDPAGGPGTWRIARIGSASGSGVGSLNDVSCPSATLCVAVDGAGDVITSTDPTGGAGAWHIGRVQQGEISRVSCASTTWCVAVDASGNVLTTTDPTGGIGAWSVVHVHTGALQAVSCPSSSFCAAIGGNDVVASTDPAAGASAWKAKRIEYAVEGCGHYDTCPDQLVDISCASAELCVVNDNSGFQYFSSTDPAGGSPVWTTFTSNGGRSPIPADGPLSCPASSLCVSGNGVVSTDPAGGSSTWVGKEIDGGNQLTGIACALKPLCVAVDDAGHAVTLTPAGFKDALIDPAFPIQGAFLLPADVSCAGSSVCVVVGGLGDILASRDPTAGMAWSRVSYGLDNGPDHVSCPTVSFCVALGYRGSIRTSTDRSATGSSWSLEGSLLPPCPYICDSLTSLSCPSAALCVAGSNQGEVFVSRDPAGGSRTWKRHVIWATPRYGSDPLQLSCPSVELCVAADPQGRIFTAVDPGRRGSAWRITDLGPSHPLGALSCPFVSLCVVTALDTRYQEPTTSVYVSRNLTGGRTAWTETQAPIVLSGFACVSRTRCVAAGGESVSVASVEPFSLARKIRPRLTEDLAPSGHRALLECLLRRVRCRYQVRAPTAGTMEISWRVNGTLVAQGAVTFTLAGAMPITLDFTHRGRRRLADRRQLAITAAGSFTGIATPAVVAHRTVYIGRPAR